MLSIDGSGVMMTLPAVGANSTLTLVQVGAFDADVPAINARAVLLLDGVQVAVSRSVVVYNGTCSVDYVFDVDVDWPARRVGVEYQYESVDGWRAAAWRAMSSWPEDRVVRQ